MSSERGGFTATRVELHRVAAHILARRRHDVSGRFGLRPSPGGFATPAFGEGPEVIRVADGTLVREAGGGASYLPLAGASLRQLAELAEVDLDAEFSVGEETPPLGDKDAPLTLDQGALEAIADWFSIGARALDTVLAELPATAEPAVVQLWPEHFDLGTHVGDGPSRRVNLGVSPGDSHYDEPYLYVGPWSDERPGDAAYWNAAFGAVHLAGQLRRDSALDDAAEFFRVGLRGLALLRETAS